LPKILLVFIRVPFLLCDALIAQMRAILLLSVRGLLAILVCVARAAEAPSSGLETPTIQLSRSESGLTLQISGHETVSLESIKAASISQNGITVAYKNGGWDISSQNSSELRCGFSPGFRALFKPGDALGFQVSGDSTLDFSTPASNPAAVRLIFPDRGEARLSPNSSARYEPFGDSTYSFAGRGQVKVTTAEGVDFECSALVAPMIGGQLAPDGRKGETPHLARKTPLTRMALTPEKDGTVSLKLNGEKIQVPERESKKIQLANGTRFSLKVDSSRSSFDFDIQKGVCQFTLDGFPYWKALGMSGQSASVAWNTQGKQIDVKNKTTPARPLNSELLVNLTSHINASVAPGATFQYSQLLQPGTFATAAAGGEVKVFNADTGETTSVRTHNVLFTQGSPSGTLPLAQSAFNPLHLNWDTDKGVQLRGTQGSVAVGLNHSDTLQVSDDVLDVKYGQDGMLTLRAKRGNFQVRPDFVEDLTLQLSQGSALLMQVNRRDGTLSARLAEGSAGEVRANAGGSFSNPFTPESMLTLVYHRTSYSEARSANNLNWIFFEGAGGDGRTFTTTTSSSQPDSSTGFRPQVVPTDVSRIPQEPVSVIE
jgi:hypothetical protein